jgi:DNA-binding NtrC family response regulator
MSKGVVLVTRRHEFVRELFQRLTTEAELLPCDDMAQLGTLAQDHAVTAVLVHLDQRPEEDDLQRDFSSLLAESPGEERLTPENEAAVVDSRPTLEARVDELERRIIEDSLRRHNHRRKETAAELGISRVTLYNKMKKLGLQ